MRKFDKIFGIPNDELVDWSELYEPEERLNIEEQTEVRLYNIERKIEQILNLLRREQ